MAGKEKKVYLNSFTVLFVAEEMEKTYVVNKSSGRGLKRKESTFKLI